MLTLDDYIAQLKSNDTSLTTLDLSNNNIDDAGAAAIVQALQTNTSLTVLYLSGNNIGAAGAAAFARALQTNTSLTRLWITSNNIGAAGSGSLNAIANKLKANKINYEVLQKTMNQAFPQTEREKQYEWAGLIRLLSTATTEGIGLVAFSIIGNTRVVATFTNNTGARVPLRFTISTASFTESQEELFLNIMGHVV